MFSKLSRLVFVVTAIGVSAAVFSGCGLKIGEKPNQDSVVELGSAQTACLTGAARTLGDYFKGTTSDKQVSDLFSCASNSLRIFKERTRGSKLDVYSPGELRKFLERYFLRDFTISDALLVEFMELKKTLLGGTTDELTVEELDRLRSLLDTLRDVSIRLRPYLPLTPSHVSQLRAEDVEASIAALRGAAASLGKILEERASPYKFSHLDRLLGEIEKFLQDDDYIHDTAEFRKYLPLFISVKKIVVSPDAQEMSEGDWRILLTRTADLYGLLLRTSRILQNEYTLISGSGRLKLMDVSQQGYFLFRDIINSSPDKTISFCDMYAVIDEANKLFGYQHDFEALRQGGFKNVPPHLRKYFSSSESAQADEDYLWFFKYGDAEIYRGTLKQLLIPVVEKFFRPVPTSAKSAALRPHLANYRDACKKTGGVDNTKLGLRAENLDRFWNVLNTVSEGQRFLEEIFFYARKEYGGTGDPLATDTVPASLMGWLRPDSTDLNSFKRDLENLYQVPRDTLSEESVSSALVLSRMVRKQLPLFKASDPSITFDDTSPVSGSGIGSEAARWRQSFVGLSGLNAIWNLVHLTWDAYSGDPQRTFGPSGDGTTGGITQDETRQFYYDMKELGVAFNLFDPTSDTAADHRFFEANLFTYAANGDDYLSMAEGTDLVAFLYSGKQLSLRMYDMIHDRCEKWKVGCRDTGPNAASCHIGPKDVFGKDSISTACFNHFGYGDLYQQLWDHMPNLSSYYTKLAPLGSATAQPDQVYRETFTCLLETVARPSGEDPLWISSGDVDQIATLTHYLEGLFVRFDTNHSGTLNADETLLAYPVLANEIRTEVKKRVSFLSGDDDIKAVLTYIMAHGTIPSTDDWSSILGFGAWRYIYSCRYEADRARTLQVMSAILGVDVRGCFVDPHILPKK